MGEHGQNIILFLCVVEAKYNTPTDHFFLTQVDDNTIKPKKLGDTVIEAFSKMPSLSFPSPSLVTARFCTTPEVNFHYSHDYNKEKKK